MSPALFTNSDLAAFRAIGERTEAPLSADLWRSVDPSRVSPERLSAARASWALRAEGESRALDFNVRFHALCRAAEMPAELCRVVERIARDEARHVELCTRIAERLGRPDALPSMRGHRMPDPREQTSRAELTRWAVTVFCLGEVLAAGLVRALIAEQRADPMRTALRLIFRDEAQHQRFGWRLARRLVPTLTCDEREELAASLAHSMALYELAHTGSVGGSAPSPAEAAPPSDGHEGGVISNDAFARAFYDSVANDVLPPLEALGVPARDAWALRVEASALWSPARGDPSIRAALHRR